jgi:hypothetical protein
VFLNIARSDEHQNSDKWFCVEEVQIAEESTWSRCLVGIELVVADRGLVVARYRSYARPDATASARADGEPSGRGNYMSMHKAW